MSKVMSAAPMEAHWIRAKQTVFPDSAGFLKKFHFADCSMLKFFHRMPPVCRKGRLSRVRMAIHRPRLTCGIAFRAGYPSRQQGKLPFLQGALF
jgi:hypothetical protein